MSLTSPVAAFALAWALFVLAALSPRMLTPLGLAPLLVEHAWLSHAIVKTVLVLLAFAAMFRAGGSWSHWGFRAATEPRWRRSILRGGALGAVATVVIILSPAAGMTWIAELGVPGIVLWIWLHSSVTEEIFVRGWFQGFVRPARGEPIRLGAFALSPEVLLSGLLFGSMHLWIVSQGADLWTVAIIVAATTMLGIFAAEDRERTGSLGPAVATHVAFNVGGFAAGVVTTLAMFAITGQRPIP